MTDQPHDVNDLPLQRVRAEFLEMPGLRLTPEQARRLWGLDEPTCARVLELLLEEGFLFRSRLGVYGRRSDGAAVPFPRPRMAKADLDTARPVPKASRSS